MKEVRRDDYIERELERIAEQKKKDEDKTKLDQEQQVRNMAEQLQFDMLETGIKLDPYEAMLHARRMSKKMSVQVDLHELAKKSSLQNEPTPRMILSLNDPAK